MKKLLVLVVLAVVGGGVYIAFFNKKLKTEITEQVTKLVTSSNFLSVDAYEKNFDKAITFTEEKEGYVGGFSESLQMRFYEGPENSSLILASNEDQVQIFKSSFKAGNTSMEKYCSDEIQRMFKVTPDFSQEGNAKSEFADLNWYVKDSEVTVLISQKGLTKVSAVSELSKEQQEHLDKLKDIIALKIKMQTEWDELQDQKHFVLEPEKFEQITKRMQELKAQAETLSKNAKKIIKSLPVEQVMALKDKMEGGL